MDFHAELACLERSERLRAEDYDGQADEARQEKADLPKLWPMGWPELEGRKIDDKITKAELEAKISRRRADHASQGILLASPDESGSVEYMQRYAPLVSEAHKRKLARVTTESLRGLGWG
jgi:hypothetical protein